MLCFTRCIQRTAPVFTKYSNVRTALYSSDKPPKKLDNNQLLTAKKETFDETKLDEASKRKLMEIKCEVCFMAINYDHDAIVY